MSSASPLLHGLFCELYWGQERAEARSFEAETQEVLAAADETAPLPLYGFALPEEPYRLARRTERGYRIYVPPQASVEHQVRGGALQPVALQALPQEEGRPYVELEAGGEVRLREGELVLRLKPSVPTARRAMSPLRLAVTVVVMATAALSLPVTFLTTRADPEKAAEFNARALAAAREREAAERKKLDERYRSWVDTDGGSAEADRERVTLPTSLSIH